MMRRQKIITIIVGIMLAIIVAMPVYAVDTNILENLKKAYGDRADYGKDNKFLLIDFDDDGTKDFVVSNIGRVVEVPNQDYAKFKDNVAMYNSATGSVAYQVATWTGTTPAPPVGGAQQPGGPQPQSNPF